MSKLLELLKARKKDTTTKKSIIKRQLEHVNKKITRLRDRKKSLQDDLTSL